MAIGLTYLIVTSGFDWTYYNLFRQGVIFNITLPAALVGLLLPIIMPIILLIKGRNDAQAQNAGFATAQAALLAWLITSVYKVFTGRLHPEIFVQLINDISHTFRFGFLRGGVLWGWPSGHTAIAFALAFCVAKLYPESRKTKFMVLLCAIYIGLGVSISIHWFSDFVAAAIIGTLIGIVVGNSFSKRLT